LGTSSNLFHKSSCCLLRFLIILDLIELMKIKFPLLLGFIHFIILLIYVEIGFSHIFFINILFLNLLLNISSFFVLTLNFKKNLQYVMVFSAFSLICLISYTIIFFLIISIWKFSDLEKIYVFAKEAEKSYNSISGFIKIILTYLIFALLPSFIVLSAGTKSVKKKVKNRYRLKK
jgi:hypothetical protein